MQQFLSRRIMRPLLACALAAPFAAFAQTTFSVSFVDPDHAYTAYYANIENSIVAAGNQWVSQFATNLPATTLTVSVNFSNIPTLNGTSNSWSYVDTRNGVETYESGATHKLATGFDENGSDADISFGVGVNYMNTYLWFGDASQTVPSNKVDAVSAFAHEFGHAWGFNGFRDWTTGELSYGNIQSTYDSYVQIDTAAPGGTTLYFTGPRAEAVYGGPVPLTYGNYAHIANNSPRDGSDLLNDLMNGVAFGGRRYPVSALDLAILADIGAPVLAVPEPAALQLMLAGLAMGLLWRRRRA